MERYCLKGQSPQRAVAPTEEEEEEEKKKKKKKKNYTSFNDEGIK
jgi:hypothetical protein